MTAVLGYRIAEVSEKSRIGGYEMELEMASVLGRDCSAFFVCTIRFYCYVQ